MKVTANAYLSAEGNAVIELNSADNAWETAEWTVRTSTEDSPFNISLLLYNAGGAGTGVLSNSDRTLTIVISPCPSGEFLLIVGSFQKLFIIGEGEIDSSTVLVGAHQLSMEVSSNGAMKAVFPKALVLFHNSLDKAVSGGLHRGQLEKDGKVAAIVGGKGFVQVLAGNFFWPFTGVVFNRFLWNGDLPTSEEEYTFRYAVNYRGGSSRESAAKVIVGPDTVSASNHPQFTIQPTHRFIVERSIA